MDKQNTEEGSSKYDQDELFAFLKTDDNKNGEDDLNNIWQRGSQRGKKCLTPKPVEKVNEKSVYKTRTYITSRVLKNVAPSPDVVPPQMEVPLENEKTRGKMVRRAEHGLLKTKQAKKFIEDRDKNVQKPKTGRVPKNLHPTTSSDVPMEVPIEDFSETQSKMLIDNANPLAPKFVCQQCGQIFEQKLNCHAHIIEEHSESASTSPRCPVCCKKFCRPSSRNRHVRIHHIMCEKTFRCPVAGCQDHFQNQEALELHLIGHSDSTMKCKSCQISFNSKKLLLTHFQIKHYQEAFEPRAELEPVILPFSIENLIPTTHAASVVFSPLSTGSNFSGLASPVNSSTPNWSTSSLPAQCVQFGKPVDNEGKQEETVLGGNDFSSFFLLLLSNQFGHTAPMAHQIMTSQDANNLSSGSSTTSSVFVTPPTQLSSP